MVDLAKHPIFENNKVSLKEASKDSHGGLVEYMTESQYLVVNFDSVKNEYIRDLKVYQSPTSNDALLSYGEGRLIFIEFKNGNMHTNKQHDVRKKIFDSLLIFTDIAKVGISYTRDRKSVV